MKNIHCGAGRKFTLLKHSNSTSVFRGIPVTQSYWADPIEEPDNVTMAKVEILFNSVVVILCVLLCCTVCKDYNYTETRNKLINKDTTAL
jgi:hypothetical protein